MSITIFFCYAREDEILLNKLKTHLRPLQRQGLIDVWYDRDICAGAAWESEVKKHLDAAQIVLLLVSPDFMDSDYCYGVEMKRALERHERGDTKVIPIILHPVYWQGEPLGKLQVLPSGGKPVTDPEWHNVNRAFYDITQGIHKVVVQLMSPITSALSVVPEATQQQMAQGRSISPSVQQVRNAVPFLAPLTVQKLTVRRTLRGHTNHVKSVAISADGKTLISGGEDNTVKVWDLSIGKSVQSCKGHRGYVNSVAISTDGQVLVSGSDDGRIKVWDLSTGKAVRTLIDDIGSVVSVAISAGGQILASGNYSPTIKVWDLPTGQVVHALTCHTNSVMSVAISADGRILAGGSNDGTITVWDLATGQVVHIFTGHTNTVWSVAINVDEQILASGSYDHTIKVWDLATGRAVHTFTGHTSAVMSVAISADGQTLVSGSIDATVKAWDLTTGQAVHTLVGHTDSVNSVAIAAGRATLVSGSDDKTIKVWEAKGVPF